MASMLYKLQKNRKVNLRLLVVFPEIKPKKFNRIKKLPMWDYVFRKICLIYSSEINLRVLRQKK